MYNKTINIGKRITKGKVIIRNIRSTIKKNPKEINSEGLKVLIHSKENSSTKKLIIIGKE
jgi:hypothetical protein